MGTGDSAHALPPPQPPPPPPTNARSRDRDDDGSVSPKTVAARITPESSSISDLEEEHDADDEEEEEEEEEHGGVATDPLLARAAEEEEWVGIDGGYELRQGVGRGRKPGGGGGGGGGRDLTGGPRWYRDDDSDDDTRSEGEDDIVYTAAEEGAVVRKFDRRLVLFVALLYLLSFLDRSNIGNAYAAGMDADLLLGADHHHPAAPTSGGSFSSYEWALSAFYIAYIAFEWLALLWGVVPAHVYITGIVASWGVVASLQAVVGSYRGLVLLRFLLGIGEAGFTGIPIYLSFFFRREELALRTAVFISAAPLATAFASSLAWVILKLGEHGPIAPWRLLFLLEGFPAVLIATIAWRIIPDAPERASYLTAREKRIAVHRLLPPNSHHSTNSKALPNPSRAASSRPGGGVLARFLHATRDTLSDPIPWTTAGIFFLTNVAYSSLPVFLPSILEQMGHTPRASQALSAPPYLVAFVLVLAAARLSDALRARGVLIAVAALASAAGYAFLALARVLSGGGGRGGLEMWRYLAVFPAAAGFFVVVVLTVAWNVNNTRGGGGGHGKGGAFALMQVVGQCGPLLGTRLYPKGDGPWFERGMGVCAGAMLGVAVLALGLRWWLRRANGRLDSGRFGVRERDDGFRYML